ncbi:MAG: TipAS antibiotic-recognition domain-containing protein [Coriobacteriales bacterium]|nr:TipAS antibiotic-recognition domain-containing protein [Coriobacteriales bacterium]
MNQDTIALTIKKMREGAHLTQMQLATQLGVTDKTVSKWECAKGYPDITMLEKIASVLGISVSELISGVTVENSNVSANMMRTKFFVCPVCGNIIHSTGDFVANCCGLTLSSLQVQACDNKHQISIEKVEDEYYLHLDHPMSKIHYISFIVALSPDRIQLVKFYPEGSAQARFKINTVKKFMFYCNQDGFFEYTLGKKSVINMPEEVFDENKQADYDVRAKQIWGNTKEYKESQEKMSGMSKVDKQNLSEDFMHLFAEFSELKEFDPASPKVQTQVKKLQDYISEHFYKCSDEVLAGLGQMYAAGGEFTENIDRVGGLGTAQFTADAIFQYIKFH